MARGILGSLGQRTEPRNEGDMSPPIWPVVSSQDVGLGVGEQLQQDPWQVRRPNSLASFERPALRHGDLSTSIPNYSAAPMSLDAPSNEQAKFQLAGMDTPFPRFRPPFPPFPFPGTPEWTDHFIRGWRGLINEFRKSGRGGGQRRSNDDDDEDFCMRRYYAEKNRCHNRRDDYAHQDFERACIARATERWDKCNRNGGRPDPNEPPEWGPADEEIWGRWGY